MSKVQYIVKFGYLPAKQIYNINGPEFKEGCPTYDWTPAGIAKRNAFAENYINFYNRIRKNWYNRLAQDLEEKGMQDPIVITAGEVKTHFASRLPKEHLEDKSQILACIGPGCSRLYFAQKWNWDVPCVVLDFINRFPDFEVLPTEQDICDKWTNPPRKGIKLGGAELGLRGNIYFE